MPDWKAIREEFPVTRDFAFMDVANKSAPPKIVADALCHFIRNQSATSGDKLDWFAHVDRAKALFAQLISVDTEEIAMVKNTSEGFNLVANAFDYHPGDNVVITDLEHPNNTFPWLRLREMGVEVRVAESTAGLLTPEALAKYVDSKTRIVSVTAVACVTGARLDIAGMARAAHRHGAYIMVDGVQSLGMLQLNAREADVDFLAAGAYKGMLSPHGLAFLFCKKELIPSMKAAVASRANVKVDPLLHKVRQFEFSYKEDAGKFEIGNWNYGAAWAGCAALEFLQGIGIPHIESRILDTSGQLSEALQGLGLRLLGPTGRSVRSGIVSVAVEDATGLSKRLEKERILCSPREGALRFSLHMYNDEQDIETVVKALSRR